jgi:hypothetical protein
MIRAASIMLAIAAAIVGFGFVLLYLGGYGGVLEHERIALIPLIAGLAAAVLRGCNKGTVSFGTTIIVLVLLGIWAGSGIILR